MKKYLNMAAALVLLLTACTKTPEQLYEEQKTGVVMVINKYYYELKLPSGGTFYFTGLDEEGNIAGFTEDEDEVKKAPAVGFGTAFFVTETGTLLTNRHVASPPIDEELVKQGFENIITTLQAYAVSYMQEIQQEYDAAQAQMASAGYYDEWGYYVVDDYALEAYQQQVSQLASEFEEAQQMVQHLEMVKDPTGITITPVCELGIAYEGTTPKDEYDFLKKHPCKVIRTSGSKEVDLALLKLNSATTPADTYIFDPFEADDNLNIGDPLYMVGYNAGVELSYTKRGILSQLTKGAVTQKPDGERVLYDIATVQGSSGSPVLNENGELVAVNFAKYAKSDNFNLGIPLSAIRKFLTNE